MDKQLNVLIIEDDGADVRLLNHYLKQHWEEVEYLQVTNPGQMMILANDPLGVRLILTAVVLQVIGVLLVRKIVDIQY